MTADVAISATGRARQGHKKSSAANFASSRSALKNPQAHASCHWKHPVLAREMITHLNLSGADGVHLHAAAAGTGGRVILFLHGFPEFWQAWHRQLAEFSRDCRAIALDLRGYNLSDKPEHTQAYALERIVDDVRRVIRAIPRGRGVVLVGHDWGGITAWALARENPELIQSLVIINAPHPVIFYRELKRNWRQRIASSYAGFFQLRGPAEIALKVFDHAALRKMVFGISVKPQMFTPELRAAYRNAWNQPRAISSGLNYYRNLRALKRMVSEPAASWQVRVSTLVLWGEQDPALLTTNLMGLEQFVPRLTVRRHPTATHWIVHEEPEWVNGEIREFLLAHPMI